MGDSETPGPSIMIVEDDPKIRNMLEQYLSSEGFRPVAVSNGAQMRDRFSDENIDLVLLDIGLPGEDGLTLARELRNSSDIGIIMLTGRNDIVDRVVGIELGADDYLAKPFHLRELLARVKAVLRRLRGNHREARDNRATEPGGAAIAFGDWKLLPDQRRLVNKEGDDVILTSGEFDMLESLVRNAGRVLSRDQLLDMTRGSNWVALDRTIDAQIARLRKKIESDTRNPTFIKSVRGVGYVFAAKVKRLDA